MFNVLEILNRMAVNGESPLALDYPNHRKRSLIAKVFLGRFLFYDCDPQSRFSLAIQG